MKFVIVQGLGQLLFFDGRASVEGLIDEDAGFVKRG